jgi:hypothetical protein
VESGLLLTSYFVITRELGEGGGWQTHHECHHRLPLGMFQVGPTLGIHVEGQNQLSIHLFVELHLEPVVLNAEPTQASLLL